MDKEFKRPRLFEVGIVRATFDTASVQVRATTGARAEDMALQRAPSLAEHDWMEHPRSRHVDTLFTMDHESAPALLPQWGELPREKLLLKLLREFEFAVLIGDVRFREGKIGPIVPALMEDLGTWWEIARSWSRRLDAMSDDAFESLLHRRSGRPYRPTSRARFVAASAQRAKPS